MYGRDRDGGFGGGGGRRFGNNYASTPKPVKEGDIVELTIEATGSKGDGIAKKDGFVIFVKGASQGQTVKAKILSIGRSSASAEVVGGESAGAESAGTEAAPPAEE
jgi:predicted RNA-binding protein with TRAM domain